MWKKEENSKNWWYIDIMESKFAMSIKYYSAPPLLFNKFGALRFTSSVGLS